MSDLGGEVLRLNVALAAGVALVMALRWPTRRLFGARLAYGLWALAPLAAAAAVLVPARVVTVRAPPPQPAAAPAAAAQIVATEGTPSAPRLDLRRVAGAGWMAGAGLGLALLAWRQRQFAQAVRAGRAGPAVVGVLQPRIVTPDDFAQRYSAREQAVVLAHEAAHIARHDSRINAAVALARCLLWPNPFMHVLARHLRIDQELACDAAVAAAHPHARRAYAEAMLKTQLAARPLPMGCYWPAEGAHPLAERIRLLARPLPSAGREGAGAAALALMGVSVVAAAWCARPAQLVASPWTPASAPLAAAAPTAAAWPAAPAPAEAAPVVAPRMAAVEPVQAAVDPAPPVAAVPDLTPVSLNLNPARFGRITGGVAARSRIAPGWAVRVVASTVGDDGVPFWQDLTSFGSQAVFRKGAYGWDRDHTLSTEIRHARGSGLFTAVQQEGERLWVTASLDRRFDPADSTTVALRSGETSQLTLPNGQTLTLTATLRPETAEEQAEAQQVLSEMAARRGRMD